MESVNRRTFLKQAGMTAAAVGAVAAVPGSIGVAGATTAGAVHQPQLTHDEVHAAPAIVAQVRNAASGEIALFVGEREVTIHDRSVAARLVRAAR